MIRSKLVVVLVSVLGASSVALVTVLQRRATHSRDAEVGLSTVVNDFNALQGLPWKADVQSGGSPWLARHLMAQAEQRLTATLTQLSHDHPVAQLHAIAAPMQSNIAVFNRIRELAARSEDVPAGDLQYENQPAADRVLGRLLAAEHAYRARAASALRAAWIGAAAGARRMAPS